MARLARGIYYAHVGDALRGRQSRDETPPDRLNAADAAFKRAQADLEASVTVDPKPLLSYTHAIRISREQGNLDEGRQLLDRAILTVADNFIARASYMTAIETRWGGSQAMMQAFLQECGNCRIHAAIGNRCASADRCIFRYSAS